MNHADLPTVKNLTNYHSHCTFCDGKAPMEDFVKQAIREGFTSYGISSHAPLPFPTHWTLDPGAVGEYLAEIDRLKTEYDGRIELYAGMEIDYLDDNQNPASDYFQALPLDYRIGSVHLLHSAQGEVIDIDTSADVFRTNLERHLNGDLKQVVRAYYDKLMRMVSLGGFDIVGHADKLSFNANCLSPGITRESWYRDTMQTYFRLIAREGLMVEINTKKFAPHGIFFPQREHFETLRKLGIPVLVNSDSHRPEAINSGRREALGALLEAGIDRVMELHEGKWVAVPIEPD